jgi:hypothetical protein
MHSYCAEKEYGRDDEVTNCRAKQPAQHSASSELPVVPRTLSISLCSRCRDPARPNFTRYRINPIYCSDLLGE